MSTVMESERADVALIAPTDESLRDVARRVPWLRLLAGFLIAYAVGGAIALALRWAGWWTGDGWETTVLVAVQETVSPALDAVMLTLPYLGTNYTLAPIMFVAAVLLARRGYASVGMHLIAVQLGSWALNPLLKFSFPRDRPTLFEARGQHAFPAFPSGHSIASVAVLLTVAYLLHRTGRGTWAYWVVGIYMVVNGYSRVYLGVHWLSDVIAGTIVGGIWLLWTVRVLRGIHPVR
jgi:membrane-associated phospholipid phosphatase